MFTIYLLVTQAKKLVLSSTNEKKTTPKNQDRFPLPLINTYRKSSHS